MHLIKDENGNLVQHGHEHTPEHSHEHTLMSILMAKVMIMDILMQIMPVILLIADPAVKVTVRMRHWLF